MMRVGASFALKAVMFANVFIFCEQREKLNWLQSGNIFSVSGDQSISAMMHSMFMHADAYHLASNMIGLWVYGQHVFIRTSSRIWNSSIAFAFLYIGAGLTGCYGAILVSSLHDLEWKQRLVDSRKAFHCSHWICRESGLNYISQPFFDALTHVQNADLYINRQLFKLATRIGASSCVYGILGARMYTSSTNVWHDKMHRDEMVLLVLKVAFELKYAPIRLENLSLETNVDHVGHIFGFFGGIVIAWIIQKVSMNQRFTFESFQLYATALANILSFIFQKRFLSNRGRATNFMISIFTNPDLPYLLFNLAVLIFIGGELFVNTSSKTWKKILHFNLYRICNVGL
mmetsp:Transcript_37271/g.86938  ORF Transcript_37271/g.86938 Transcript_37271/m.86938 type:complete len:344 (-) Transcript_37271:971-2002(-)